MIAERRILFRGLDDPELRTIDGYRRRGGYRALVRHGPGAYADVRLALARSRRTVRTVRVTLVRRAALDRTGRRLAAHLKPGGSPR